MEYLGHVISEEGISPNPDKVKAACEFPVPTSVKDGSSWAWQVTTGGLCLGSPR